MNERAINKAWSAWELALLEMTRKEDEMYAARETYEKARNAERAAREAYDDIRLYGRKAVTA